MNHITSSRRNKSNLCHGIIGQRQIAVAKWQLFLRICGGILYGGVKGYIPVHLQG